MRYYATMVVALAPGIERARLQTSVQMVTGRDGKIRVARLYIRVSIVSSILLSAGAPWAIHHFSSVT